MPPRHLHNHPSHSLQSASTNGRQLAKTRRIYWDIWQGHSLCSLKGRSAHTAFFVKLCQAELRVETSLPQPLTSACCFFSSPGRCCVHPVLICSATQRQSRFWLLLWCCCSGVLLQSPRRTKPKMTQFSKEQAEGNVGAKTHLLLHAAPQQGQKQETRRW